jgi:hypothetical protein
MENGRIECANLYMAAWQALLPCTDRHHSIKADLCALLKFCQQQCPGAMYSGCGGGYLYLVSGSQTLGGGAVAIGR